MKIQIHLIALAAVLLGVGNAAAQQTLTVPDLSRGPVKDTSEDSELFAEIQREARELNQAIYESLLRVDGTVVPVRAEVEEQFPLDGFRDFGRLVRRNVEAKMGEQGIPKLSDQLAYFERTLLSGELGKRTLPEFMIVPLNLSQTEWRYQFSGDVDEHTGVFGPSLGGEITVDVGKRSIATTRAEALLELREAIAPYKLNDAAYDALRNRTHLLKMADEWNGFFDEGRPQTFLDITLTTRIEYKHTKKDYLTGPPARQWFALHPNVVIENLSAAPDGDELGAALAIEWIGVNWWDGVGALKFPIGVSACSLYSDRPGVDSVGHGVMVYLDNKYCIGWASHGGDNGFFASLDVLELVDNKRTKLEQYRSRLTSILDR